MTVVTPAVAHEVRDALEAPPVVVTASRTEQRLTDAPGAISVIPKAELERRNLYAIDQAVATIPGVFDKRSKGILDTLGGVQIRGVPDDNRSLFLLDGIPLNDGYTGGVRLGGLATADVSRIEVLRGPGSSLYGGSAMGGVVHVITKMPTSRLAEVRGGLGKSFGSDYGLDGIRTLTARIGDRFDSGLSLLASLSRRNVEGYHSDLVTSTATPPGSITGAVPSATAQGGATRIMGERGRNGWSDYDAAFSARYEINAAQALQLRLRRSYYDYSYGNPITYLRDASGNPAYNFTNGSNTLRQSSFTAGAGENQRDIVQLSYEGEVVGGQARVQAASIDTGMNRFITPDSTNATLAGGPGRVSNSPSTTRLVDAQWTRGIHPEHVLTVGASLRWDSANVQERALADWRSFDSQTGPFLVEARGKALTTSVFGQDQWNITPALAAYLGLRWDQWKATDGYSQDLNPTTFLPRPGFPRTFPDRQDSAWSPKLGIVWQVDEKTTFRSSIGTAFRAPQMYDLYRTWVSTAGTIFRANPDLTPETIRSVDAGIEVRPWSGGKIAATAFQNDLHDLIYRRTVTNLTEAQALCGSTATVTNCRHFVNAGRATSRGIEVEIAQTTGTWQWFANATFIDSKVKENAFAPASVGRRLTGVPKIMANAGSTVTSGPLTATAVARYVGKTFRDDSNADTLNGVYGAQDPRTLVDVKASWRVDHHATVSVAVDNVFDRRYFDFYRGPGRTIFADFTYSFF